jgi:Mce-associated membrane protein
MSTSTVETPEGLEEPEEVTEEVSPRRWKSRLPALLVAGAVVLAGAGAWFTVEAASTSSSPAAANHALTDVGATSEVTSAVTLALNRIFSYSYDKTGDTEKVAAAVLRGKALTAYNQLFTQVREKAPAQKLVLTTRVAATAVQELNFENARLLVFLDQSATRADNNSSSVAAAQLSVTAQREAGGWVITDLVPR